MQLDPENTIVKLCEAGMEREGLNNIEAASDLFNRAWNQAQNETEKFVAAHYLARQQKNISGKLSCDKIALELALKIKLEDIKGTYPSLYLNIAKCYEDLNEFVLATENYNLAASFENFLNADGYGILIKSGIHKGLERITFKHNK